VTISKHTLERLIDAAEEAFDFHEERAIYGTEPGMTHAALCAEYAAAARDARRALGIDTD